MTTPSGNPASLVSSINIMQAPGSRSDGFIKQVFPVTRAMGNIYRYKISTQLIGYSHYCEPISRCKHLVLNIIWLISYPQWNHSREVEWGNASSDAQGHTESHCVHILSNSWQGLSKLKGGNTAAMLHHLCNSSIKL